MKTLVGDEIVEPTAPGPVVAAQDIRRLSVCLSVADLDVSLAWYQDVLGFRTRKVVPFPDLDARVAFVEAGDFRFELVQTLASTSVERPEPPGHTAVRGLTQLTLYVRRLDPVLERLAARNVDPAMPPVTVGALGIRAFFVRDADGNLIEFIEDQSTDEGVP
jgi:catechol 2,3-dioxygenase-like lactoylglutathione lyase family enzyme